MSRLEGVSDGLDVIVGDIDRKNVGLLDGTTEG